MSQQVTRKATRRAVMLGVTTLAGAALAACGGAAAPAPAEQVASGPYPYKIVTGSNFAAGERLEWAKLTAEEFTRQNSPKMTAEHVIIGTNDALFAAMAAGTGPDVTRTSGAWFSDYVDKGQLVDLTPYVKRDKLDLNRWYQQEEMLFRKSKQYAMPYWQAHSIYMFNKTLFDKAGLRPPDNENWTWNNLLETAQRLTKPGETYGIQMGNGFEFAWLNFIRSAGEDYVNKERTKTTLNTPGNLATFQWLVDLLQRHKVHPTIGDTSLGAGDWWLQGKIGIRLNGTGALGATLTAKPDFEWDMFVTPKHPASGRRAVTANENSQVVTTSTKNPEAAFKLAHFFSEKYAQDLIGKFRINTPSLKTSAADTTGWLSTPPANMKVSLEQMKHAGTLSFHVNWLQWYNEITTLMLPAFRGESSVKEAADKASQIGDTLLKGA
jgi:multiple sugar transport system substrate-binding protein